MILYDVVPSATSYPEIDRGAAAEAGATLGPARRGMFVSMPVNVHDPQGPRRYRGLVIDVNDRLSVVRVLWLESERTHTIDGELCGYLRPDPGALHQLVRASLNGPGVSRTQLATLARAHNLDGLPRLVPFRDGGSERFAPSSTLKALVARHLMFGQWYGHDPRPRLPLGAPRNLPSRIRTLEAAELTDAGRLFAATAERAGAAT